MLHSTLARFGRLSVFMIESMIGYMNEVMSVLMDLDETFAQ